MMACAQHEDGHVVYEFEPSCHLGAKLAGVHWWFKSRAHAAELTAGYYNTRERDGYAELMAVLKKNNCRLSFTCVEMRDCEHPPEGRCSPQGESPTALLISFPLCLFSWLLVRRSLQVGTLTRVCLLE
jgi:beta-amylase